MYGKSNMEIYITICKIANEFGCMSQETQTGTLNQLKELEWGGR